MAYIRDKHWKKSSRYFVNLLMRFIASWWCCKDQFKWDSTSIPHGSKSYVANPGTFGFTVLGQNLELDRPIRKHIHASFLIVHK